GRPRAAARVRAAAARAAARRPRGRLRAGGAGRRAAARPARVAFRAVAHTEVNGHRLYYERRGSGDEPLLLIMGMTGNHLHWGQPFLSRIEPHFDVVLYDHRGIGGSDRVSAPFSIADLADDAVALLEALGIEEAHVM